MAIWEYMTTPLIVHNTAAILNNWGAQGWELVQVVHGSGGRPRRLPEARAGGQLMSRIEDRVAELGLTLPVTSKPVAAYIPAIVTGNLVFTSGQLPMVDGVLPTTGKVGAEVVRRDREGSLAPACSTGSPRLAARSVRWIGSRGSSRLSASWHPPPISPASPA